MCIEERKKRRKRENLSVEDCHHTKSHLCFGPVTFHNGFCSSSIIVPLTQNHCSWEITKIMSNAEKVLTFRPYRLPICFQNNEQNRLEMRCFFVFCKTSFEIFSRTISYCKLWGSLKIFEGIRFLSSNGLNIRIDNLSRLKTRNSLLRQTCHKNI